MSVDGRIVQQIRQYLLAAGTPFPGWGANGASQDVFQSAVAAALVKLRSHEPDIQLAAAEIAGRLTGLGVLQPLLNDPADTIQELIVRDGFVQVERAGRIEDRGALAPNAEFQALVTRTADHARRQLTGSRPYVLADLPDGARFTAIIPPLSAAGTAINVRRFPRRRLTFASLEERWDVWEY